MRSFLKFLEWFWGVGRVGVEVVLDYLGRSGVSMFGRVFRCS